MKLFTNDFPDEYKKTANEYLQVFNMLKGEFIDLKWTITCPPLILEGEADEKYDVEKNVQSHSIHNGIKAGNLAKIIVNELTEKKFVHARIGMVDNSE
ncbi:unnamed protein product, partial [Rotaria magnacalcarata]